MSCEILVTALHLPESQFLSLCKMGILIIAISCGYSELHRKSDREHPVPVWPMATAHSVSAIRKSEQKEAEPSLYLVLWSCDGQIYSLP